MHVFCLTSGGSNYSPATLPELVIARHLVTRGHVVTLIVTSDGVLAATLRDAGVRVHACPFINRWRTFGGRLRAIAGLRALRHLGAGADCVFSMRLSTTPIAVRLGRKLTTPVVTYLHGMASAAKHVRYETASADAVIAISDAVMQPYLESRPADARRSQIARVILNGIDTDRFREAAHAFDGRERLRIAPDDFLIGMAGAYPAKGLEAFVRAAAKVKAAVPRARFAVAGDFRGGAEFEGRMKALLREADLEDSFCFPGYQANIAPIMQASDIWVVPSLVEGLGMVALEAMSLRKPVVASRTGGLPEVVEHDRNGLLVSPGNDDELADALISLARDRARRERLGMEAVSRTQEKFTLQRQLSAVTETLETVVTRTRNPAPSA